MAQQSPYHDILHKSRPPHPHRHPPMSLEERGAQFAAFSPLTGHNSALDQAMERHVQSLETKYAPISPEGDVE